MIIPLEKLVEYKGNRYELACAMIDLSKRGRGLLSRETKLNDGKMISVVIKNIVDGKIKYDYEKDGAEVDKLAPYKYSEEVYDETQFEVAEEPVVVDEDEDEDVEELEGEEEAEDTDDEVSASDADTDEDTDEDEDETDASAAEETTKKKTASKKKTTKKKATKKKAASKKTTKKKTTKKKTSK